MKQAPAAPLRRLLPLGVLVLGAHLVLLQAPPNAVSPTPPAQGASFATRTIAATAPVAPAVRATPPAAGGGAGGRADAAAPAEARGDATAPAGARRVTAATRPGRAVPGRARDAPVMAQAAPAGSADSTGATAAADQASPAAPAASAGPSPALPSEGSSAPAIATSPQEPLAAAAPAPPATLPQVVLLPPPATYRYDVFASYRGITLQGEGELAWRHDGQAYEMQMEARSPLLGSRRQRSTGRITAQGLVPEHFNDRARGEQATHFDPAGGRITFSNNRPEAQWLAGVQDRLSLVLQLAVIVGGEPQRYPAGTRVVVPTASTREADTWIFTVEGEEDLVLPGGKVQALKLQRLPRREYDVKLELWLAPRMDYAPVRLRLTNPNGDTVDQRWSSTDRG